MRPTPARCARRATGLGDTRPHARTRHHVAPSALDRSGARAAKITDVLGVYHFKRVHDVLGVDLDTVTPPLPGLGGHYK